MGERGVTTNEKYDLYLLLSESNLIYLVIGMEVARPIYITLHTREGGGQVVTEYMQFVRAEEY